MINLPISKVHRLGQDRDVFVKRLVIADTVEDRILQMQETKVRLEVGWGCRSPCGLRNLQKNLADGSLGEGNGKKVGRLSVKQLASRTSFSSPFTRIACIDGWNVGSIWVGPPWKRAVDCDRGFVDLSYSFRFR